MQQRLWDGGGALRPLECLCPHYFLGFLEDKLRLSDPQWDDVHVITGALKLFFRELPEPLLPYSFFDECIASVSKCVVLVWLGLPLRFGSACVGSAQLHFEPRWNPHNLFLSSEAWLWKRCQGILVYFYTDAPCGKKNGFLNLPSILGDIAPVLGCLRQVYSIGYVMYLPSIALGKHHKASKLNLSGYSTARS